MTGPIAVDVSRSGTASHWRDRLAAAAEAGATEVAFQPAGEDLRRELRAFIEAASTRSRFWTIMRADSQRNGGGCQCRVRRWVTQPPGTEAPVLIPRWSSK